MIAALSFDDVDYPSDSEVPEPISPPEHFSAVSRGVLKIEDDGAHTCSGSWAMTNEHFQSGLTFKYHFGIQARDAADDAMIMLDRMQDNYYLDKDDRLVKNLTNDGVVAPSTLANSAFPIDSTQYISCFKLRKGTQIQTIFDRQIVLKYVKNSEGSYNAYGKGRNDFGTFDLRGTLILQGKTHGLMQLYRTYLLPPEPSPKLGGWGHSHSSMGLLPDTVLGGIDDSAPGAVEQLQPLSFEEKKALAESINLLPESLLPRAMQIIRKSGIVNDDDDGIDLDIDQIDTKTQMKLQDFVMESVKQTKKKKKSVEQRVMGAGDLQPLSFEEQEALSESVNLLPERLLPGAMQIIGEYDDEIDLDIDQLDTKTQRKLQGFVMENVRQTKKKKEGCGKSSSSSKRRKTSLATCLSIDQLPDTIMCAIADFLPKSSRALLAVAISSATNINCNWNNEQWETLDFADLEKELAAKLTDDDISSIFDCIDAVKKLKTLKLTGLVNVIGYGLRSLSSSVALRQIDLSLVGKHDSPALKPGPLISERVVLPILDSLVDTFGNTLKHIQLPKKWRMKQSSILERFLVKYNKCLNNRFIGCSKCDGVIWDGKEEKKWVSESGPRCGRQNSSCYECTGRFCHQCIPENTECSDCLKKFCIDCIPTKQCTYCNITKCSGCDTMLHCEQCRSDLCNECIPVETCSDCNRTRCMDCVPHNFCDGQHCDKSNCQDCVNQDNVQWCEDCQQEFCHDCRLKEYHKDTVNCCGCRGLLLDRLIIENESLRGRVENEDQNQEPSI